MTFGVIPLAHWTSVEGWTSFEVFARKISGVDLFGWDPVSELASVFIKTRFVLVAFSSCLDVGRYCRMLGPRHLQWI